MGIPSREHVDARHSHEPDCRHDRGKAPPCLCQGRGRWAAARLASILAALWFLTGPASAESLRIATFNAELKRDGPGLLLRDILSGDDPQIKAFAGVISRTKPDILVLQRVDYDHGLVALSALRDAIARDGPDYPYIFALHPNSGMPTGLDMDGDGRLGDARDAQGYGKFSGHGGMAILSRHPIDADAVQDFSAMLWQDLPDALLPIYQGGVFPSEQALAVQRLSNVGHWAVPVMLDGGTLTLLVFHAAAPVFDGPEDRNGRRNHDELRFWQHFLDGTVGVLPAGPVVLVGAANLDPVKGQGIKSAIVDLLRDKRLQDPRPMREGQSLVDGTTATDPRLDTVFWPGTDIGAARVDYILPSATIQIADSGVHWPSTGTAGAEDAQVASRHRLVWVDLVIGDVGGAFALQPLDDPAGFLTIPR